MIAADKLLRHYRESKAFHRQVPFTSFVHENVFLTRKGAYGVVMKLAGVDDECLTEGRLEMLSSTLTAAFTLFDERFRIYQYLIKGRQDEVVRNVHYPTHTVHRVVEDRAEFLRNHAALHTMTIYLVILLEPGPKQRQFKNRAPERAAERKQSIECLLAKAHSLRISLGESIGPRLLDQSAAFAFFRILLNLDRHIAERLKLKSPRLLDYQVVASRLNWDHEGRLSCGVRKLKILSLKELPTFTAPNLFRDLAAISADMILWSEFARVSNSDVRKSIAEQRKYLWNLKRISFGQILSKAARNDQSETDADLEDSSARILIRELQQALVAMEADGGYFGKFSFGIVLHGAANDSLEAAASEAHRILTNYGAEAIEETYGALSAYFAMLPGNGHYNVRRLWIQNNHHADLSFVYTPYLGAVRAREVGDEYLAVFETRQGTPFYLDPYYNGAFGISIFGPRGSGKSVLGNFLSSHAQKYGGHTFVFDVGGSFEENARYFGGSVLKITLGRQSFAINPFSLEETPDNQQFLANFVRLLMGGDLSREDDKHLVEAIAGMYTMYTGTELMRLGTLADLLPSHLRHRLAKWVGDGQYSTLFDHETDTLQFSRFVVFDMQGVEEHGEVAQPLLYYLFFRIRSILHDPAQTGIFKLIAIDELWKYLENERVVAFVNDVIKTGRKHLVGVILMTQSVGDLGPHTELIRDNCKMAMLLANANADRQHYTDHFGLNDREFQVLGDLQPREILLKTPDYSKVLRLNIDAKSYWRFTTSPLEKVQRQEAFARYGENAIDYLSTLPYGER